MKRFYRNIIFGLIALLNISVFSQSAIYNFEELSLEEGLSQSSVTIIYQDNKGFLWFGTANGLNKYDGYTFKVYKHTPSDFSTLSNDMITAIEEDSYGNLWIGTEDGLNRFIPETETFERFKYKANSNSISSNAVYSLIAGEDGVMWIGTMDTGLNKYDPADGKFINYVNAPGSAEEPFLNTIRTIQKDKKGRLWLATYGGLVRFDPSSNSFKNYSEVFKKQVKNNESSVFSLLIDNDGIIWFGTERTFNNFDPVTDKVTTFISGGRTYLDYLRISAIAEDSKGNIWIGTSTKGVILFNKKNHSVRAISSNSSQATSLSENSILSLYVDRSGVVWIGTSTSGINKYIGNKNKFEHFKNEPGNPNSITGDVIYGIYKDSYGYLWVGTTSGLNRIDSSGTVKRYVNNTDCQGCISHNMITAITEDKFNNVWIATRWGLSKYNRSRDNFTVYRVDTAKINGISSSNLSSLYADKEGNLWIGSFVSGLDKLDPGIEKFTHYSIAENGINSDRIYSISEDMSGNLLIGTDMGLTVFDKKAGKAAAVYESSNKELSLNTSIVLTVFCDSSGIIWIGTYGGGLNRLDRKNKQIEYISEAEGLPNNVIYGILPDGNNNLWLSTNKGLVKFNKNTRNIRIYDPSDGLQSYEFNSNSSFRAPDGEMFFGGVNGYNSFYPSEVKDNPSVPGVVITSIKMPNKSFNKAEIINGGDDIEFSYNENFISFDFVALDYTKPSKNKYKYMLAGFDENWIDSGNRRFAAYTNLPPGEYLFKVMGSNNDEVWNKTGASFRFVINPPFWRTWWFYAVSILVLAGTIIFVHKYRLRLQLKQLMEIEKMRKRIADDFHDELGHKLTKISLYSELMKKDLNGSYKDGEDYLKKINSAANTLFDDTKDFIWSLDPVKDSLYDLAVYLKDFGDELFDKTGIAFRVNSISNDLAEIILPMDWKRQLILIFKEAMNNCLRHSAAENVTLSVSMLANEIKIILFDDGKGFISVNGTKGRGINNMNNRALKINAALSVESVPGKGTTIIFTGYNPAESGKKESRVVSN